MDTLSQVDTESLQAERDELLALSSRLYEALRQAMPCVQGRIDTLNSEARHAGEHRRAALQKRVLYAEKALEEGQSVLREYRRRAGV